MKLRTRKFLAGLLSLGLLLQAASPLSALAAETAGGEPTLTVEIGNQTFTVSPTENGKAQADDPEAWKEAAGGLDRITYENNTYTFHGWLSTTTGMTITGNGNPSIAVDGNKYAVYGDLTVKDVNDVVLTSKELNTDPVVTGSVNINCSGDVRIKNNGGDSDSSKEIEAVSGSLTVNTTGGNVKIRGKVYNDAKIDTTGIVELNCPNGAAFFRGLTVKNASYVGISSKKGNFGNRGDIAFENCTGTIEFTDEYGAVFYNINDLKVTSPSSYKIYAGSNESSAQEKTTLSECGNSRYIRLEMGAEQARPVATLTVLDEFSSYYTTVTYILNRYEDGSISWKNGQNPWGDEVRVEYDAVEKTYVFTGNLSMPAESNEDWMTLICSDAENDSILINGNIDAGLRVGVGNDTSGAKNFTIKSDSTKPAILKGITFNCAGNLTIMNASGPATGEDGVYSYGSTTKNITVTGNSTNVLIGDMARLNGKENITVENLSGPITYGEIKVENSKGDVKITGKSSEGLMLSSDAAANITAATLTMKNDGGVVGKVKFTKPADSTENYVAYTNEAKTKVMAALPDGNAVESSYLRVEPGEKPAVKYDLTLTNAKAYTDADYTVEADKDDAGIYSVAEGTKVYVVAEEPDADHQWHFAGWEENDKTDDKITVTVNENMTLTAKWQKMHQVCVNGDAYPDGSVYYYPGQSVELTAEKENAEKVHYTFNGWTKADDSAKFTTDSDMNNKTITIVMGSDDADVKLTTNWIKSYKVTLGDNCKLVNDDANNGFYKENAVVTVEVAERRMAQELAGVTVTPENGEAFSAKKNEEGYYTFEMPACPVTVTAKYNDVYTVIVDGTPRECAKGEQIKLDADTDDSDKKFIEWNVEKGEITDSGFDKAAPNAILTPTGDVTLTAVYAYKVTVRNGELVGEEGQDEFYKAGETVNITSEKPEYAESFNGWTSNSGVTFVDASSASTSFEMPKNSVTVKADWKMRQHIVSEDWTSDKDGHWHACSGCDYKVDYEPHIFENGECSVCGYPDPAYVPEAPDDIGGGSGAGGAVAAVIVGGAAVWGGYEVATRVILHNILPEGAAIPANRGQLALLVWNTAGRPEPVNTPAFVDVADADTAKAAQWCVEQGLMDAKSESTFKPEGWVPKFKTIEVWEKAFPNK